MRRALARLVADESGATTIEYGLIAAMLGVGIIAALKSVGNNVASTVSTVSSDITKQTLPVAARARRA